jgi:hypothetical protein
MIGLLLQRCLRIPKIDPMTAFRSLLLLLLAGLLGGLAGPATAQSPHGEIATVSGRTLRVELNDSLSVEPGTVGRVVEERIVGGNRVQMSFAVATVSRVERPIDGPWVAVCEVTRQSEDLDVGDQVQFEAVYPRARLTVRTTPPSATVFLDSIEVGQTPLQGPVGEGRHTLRLEQEGYHPVTRTFTVRRGQNRRFEDTLRTARGTLVVNTLPEGAAVQVGDRSLGTTPLSTTLQSATYELRVERDGYLPVERTVTVASDQEQRLNLDLQRPLRVRLAGRQADPVVNSRLKREGDRLVLTYDLVGDAEAYDVELELSTDGGQTFEPLPETVAGAVGNEVAPGREKQLVWAAIEDFPEGLPESGNRLRLAAEPAGGGNTLYWVLGGTLTAGASGAAAVLLGLIGGDSGGGGGNGGGDLPTSPPAPPN